jgi:hypothetical protein
MERVSIWASLARRNVRADAPIPKLAPCPGLQPIMVLRDVVGSRRPERAPPKPRLPLAARGRASGSSLPAWPPAGSRGGARRPSRLSAPLAASPVRPPAGACLFRRALGLGTRCSGWPWNGDGHRLRPREMLCEHRTELFTRERESPLYWFTGQLPVRPALALAPREAWLTPWGALGAVLAGDWLGLGPSPSDARGGIVISPKVGHLGR